MKTKKIRIAVVMTPEEEWGSCGASGLTDKKMIEYAHEDLGEFGAVQYWVEVEIPIPEAETIQGILVV